jgi:hypothetical protein
MLSRAEVRQLKLAVRRESNPAAAERLLADSVRKGHDKLALHRYLALHRIDAARCAPYEDYCRQVASCLPDEALRRVLRHVG